MPLRYAVLYLHAYVHMHCVAHLHGPHPNRILEICAFFISF